MKKYFIFLFSIFLILTFSCGGGGGSDTSSGGSSGGGGSDPPCSDPTVFGQTGPSLECNGRTPAITGVVYRGNTSTPVPGVNIEIRANNNIVGRVTSDGSGNFCITYNVQSPTLIELRTGTLCRGGASGFSLNPGEQKNIILRSG